MSSPLTRVNPRIHIPLDIVVPHLLAIGLEENPYEACGLIVPSLSVPPINWVHRMINRAENPFSSYRLDPATIQQLLEDVGAEERVWEDVIVWHTHPSGYVGPSPGDMANRLEGLKYLVVSIPRGEAVYF